MKEYSLVIKDLSKAFKNNKVLNQLTYHFDRGNVYCIVGKNGCGKSTLFKILLNLIHMDEGKIYCDGQISGLIEEATGYPYLPALDQLKYLLKDQKDLIEAIPDLAQKLEMTENLNKKFSQLSLGMKEKLNLIYSFLTPCDILLLDEPTVAIDSKSIEILLEEIEEKRKKGGTILIATHDAYFMNKIKRKIILELKDGKLEEIDNQETYDIRIKCRNSKFNEFLLENHIEFSMSGEDYVLTADDQFLLTIFNIRKEMEILNISFIV